MDDTFSRLVAALMPPSIAGSRRSILSMLWFDPDRFDPDTLDQIVAEASRLPTEQVAEVVDRLTAALLARGGSDLEEAWKRETRRRLAELESGEVRAVPGDQVSDAVRKLVGR